MSRRDAEAQVILGMRIIGVRSAARAEALVELRWHLTLLDLEYDAKLLFVL